MLAEQSKHNGAWSPSEYLLYGRYCELEAITEQLDLVRETAKATGALLLVTRGTTFFYRLLLASHRDPELTEVIQGNLSVGPDSSGKQTLALEMSSDTETLRTALLRLSPFDSVPEILLDPDLDVLSIEGRKILSDAAPPLAKVSVLVSGANRTNSNDPDVVKTLEDLMVMVNASAPVVVHGSLVVQRFADNELDEATKQLEPEKGLPHSSFDEPSVLTPIAKKLLSKALELTHSSLGNVYIADRDAQSLRLIASHNNLRRQETIETDQKSATVVAWVYRRRRPMVINDISDFKRTYRSKAPLDVSDGTSPPYAELAVPIIQHSVSTGSETVVGVVNIEKLQGIDEGHFTYRDLTLLRSVANRLAMWRADEMLRHTASSLARMTRSVAIPAERGAERTSEREFDPRVPSDALGVRQLIDETLERTYSLTRSHSATVRLLSPDRKWLMRFSAYPANRMSDPEHAIPVKNRKSVVAWVAREGRECVLDNVKDKLEIRRYPDLEGPLEVREGTRSELCLPIFVSNRLVGTLNLESRFRGGYANSFHTAEAVAEQVGLALQFGRRSHEQAVFSMSTASTASVHELFKVADTLIKLADDGWSERDVSSELRAAADDIKACIQSGTTQVHAGGMNLSELLETVVKELAIGELVTVRGAPGQDLVLPPANLLSLKVALTALFDNANNYAHNADSLLEARWRDTSVGGRDYVTLLIGNTVWEESPPEVLSKIFRQPLSKEPDDRVHIGAFTAAALVRSFGGDVFVFQSGPPHFVVGVDIPIEQDARNR